MIAHAPPSQTKAQFNGVLTELSAHGFNKDDLRMTVEPLTEKAKEALFEQLKYLGESTPGHRLPDPMTVLVHAEVGGKFLKLVHGVRTKMTRDDRFRKMP
ncbi:hypothetical protein JCM10021v2_004134 [Rhodotorula toruloides]